MLIDSKRKTKSAVILKDLNEHQRKCDAVVSFRISSVELQKLQKVAKDNGTTISKVIKTTLKHAI